MPTASDPPVSAGVRPPVGVEPSPSVETCFRVGTVGDLTHGLRFAHEHGIVMPDRAWGLKLLGYAVCARVLHDPRHHRGVFHLASLAYLAPSKRRQCIVTCGRLRTRAIVLGRAVHAGHPSVFYRCTNTPFDDFGDEFLL